MRDESPSRRVIDRTGTVLTLCATLALAFGMLVYLSERDARQVLLMPTLLALGSGPLFGPLGAWLPSFVHPFAFSLLTAAARPRAAAPAYGACVAWWLVNLAFEVGQLAPVSRVVAHELPRLIGDGLPTRVLSAYLVQGRCDIGDVLAATAGALAAAAVLHRTHQLREAHHAH